MRILPIVSIILIFFLSNFSCLAKNINNSGAHKAKNSDKLSITKRATSNSTTKRSSTNYNKASELFDLVIQKKWQDSYSLALKTGDPVLKKIVLSQQYMDSEHTENSFEEIIKFLKENPSWPQNYILKLRAESLLNPKSDKKIIVEWFSKNTPVIGKGYKYYALAASSLVKDPKKLTSIIKAGWHFGNFTDLEQKAYYKNFRQYLTLADHVKKIDNHLWEKDITSAKASLKYVNAKYKQSFNACIALIKKHKNARKLFKRVPKQYYTSSLIYNYLLSRKTDLPTGSEIAELSRIASIDKKRADNFWKIQAYLAREFIEKKRYLDAYKVASRHFTSNPSHKSEAEYLSGWLALNFLKKPDLALLHFRSFNRIVKMPISKARGIYWLARAHEYKKDIEKSQKLYSLAASKYPYTFYGQMSAIELNHRQMNLPTVVVNMPEHNNNLHLKNNEIVRAAQIVSKYGPNSLSQIYIKEAISQTKNIKDIYSIVNAIAQSNNIHHTSWAAKFATHKHVLIKDHAYPTPFKISNLPIETALAYSIIRQESVFYQQAVSQANALGLMQLIETTACETANSINVKCHIPKLTSDPDYNMKLGSHYLKSLIDKYDGSYVLAAAEYNGGHVDKWLQIFGDPRKLKTHREVLNWLEHIPFYETRDYVQRVLENLQIYRSVLEKNNKFRLADDLLNKKRS